jgi:hypothetical protein
LIPFTPVQKVGAKIYSKTLFGAAIALTKNIRRIVHLLSTYIFGLGGDSIGDAEHVMLAEC